MSDSDSIPPLRMAARGENEQLAHQITREQTILDRKREEELEQSLAPMRVGSVPYLNSVPLTRGLEDQIVFAPPSKLAGLLRRRWKDIKVEQAGADGIVSIKDDEFVTILRVLLPDDLKSQATEQLNRSWRQRLETGLLFQVEYGSRLSMEKQ